MPSKTPRATKQSLMRAYLPYGLWTCLDGSKILFNRKYNPIWKMSPTGSVTAVEPDRWIDFNNQEWYFKDRNLPWRNKKTFKKCVDVLRDWGVVDRLPNILTN